MQNSATVINLFAILMLICLVLLTYLVGYLNGKYKASESIRGRIAEIRSSMFADEFERDEFYAELTAEDVEGRVNRAGHNA